MRRAEGASRESPKTSAAWGLPPSQPGAVPFSQPRIFQLVQRRRDSRRCGVGGGRSPFHGAAAGRRGSKEMSIALVSQLLGAAAENSHSVGASTAVELASANTQCKCLWIQNQGSVGVYISTLPGVSASAGYLLAAGATFQDQFTGGSWYAIAAMPRRTCGRSKRHKQM